MLIKLEVMHPAEADKAVAILVGFQEPKKAAFEIEKMLSILKDNNLDQVGKFLPDFFKVMGFLPEDFDDDLEKELIDSEVSTIIPLRFGTVLENSEITIKNEEFLVRSDSILIRGFCKYSELGYEAILPNIKEFLSILTGKNAYVDYSNVGFPEIYFFALKEGEEKIYYEESSVPFIHGCDSRAIFKSNSPMDVLHQVLAFNHGKVGVQFHADLVLWVDEMKAKGYKVSSGNWKGGSFTL